MPIQVPHERIGVGRREAHAVTDELRPPEAVAAVGVTGLALRREVQHGLAVLVLQAGGFGGHVGQLGGRVRIQTRTDVPHQRGKCARRHRREPQLVSQREHAPLREDQLEDRIARHVPPVDQFPQDVLVHPEGNDLGDRAHGFPNFVRQPVTRGDVIDVPRAVRPKTRHIEETVRQLRHAINHNHAIG
jgi:hypothetical protein